MAASGVQSIAVDECMPLGYVGSVAAAHGVGFIGNLRVSPEMGASPRSARENALVCMAAGGAFPGYVFGMGGPAPDAMPTELLREALEGKASYERTYDRQRPDSGD